MVPLRRAWYSETVPAPVPVQWRLRSRSAVPHRALWAGLLRVGAVLLVAGTARADPSRTVIVANSNVPESLEIARYYATVRDIPESHICRLDLPEGDAMAREDYESQLRDPLLAWLRENEFIRQEPRAERVGPHETAWRTLDSSIRFLVSTYGVPLRIADTKLNLVAKVIDRMRKPQFKNAAAVDSELALLLHPGYEINGPLSNPLYGRLQWSELGRRAHDVLIATRLDGPSASRVRRMIDESMAAERYGMQGRVYVDSRASTDDYYMGDYWLEESYHRFRREGYEAILDTRQELWGRAFPMEDCVLYMGWYAPNAVGPFARPEFRFQPGAIAYHIHSGSAVSLHTRSRYWAGPLLSRGAAATMGAVEEPYLSLTPRLNVFSDRLCSGWTFGESAYMAMSHLSWQVTVVGDPLYRPFRYTLEEQIRHLEEDEQPQLEWAYVRQANLLMRRGAISAAVQLCAEKAEELESRVLREKLGDLLAADGRLPEARRQYEIVVGEAETAVQAVRVGVKLARLLRDLDGDEQADDLLTRLKRQWHGSPLLPWLETAAP